MTDDPHDWREWLGGYPWENVALPCRANPEAYVDNDGAPADGGGTECDRCPVLEACLAFALEQRIDEGVWGGTTGLQRRTTLSDLRRRYRR